MITWGDLRPGDMLIWGGSHDVVLRLVLSDDPVRFSALWVLTTGRVELTAVIQRVLVDPDAKIHTGNYLKVLRRGRTIA